ncbi:hypothetical protein [Diaphorobacter sp.]|uniref:hypothetical protein n=1 Tax=Diaphorobacter sp. TaxID=1934310 RepID=UPI00258CC9D9|nr:hypothetical protein [Diaphorobacter sp.]
MAVVAVCGLVLVAVLIFDAVGSSNLASYIKAATAAFVTLLLLRRLKKNPKQNMAEIFANKKNINMGVAGVVIGLFLPIIFLWFVMSAFK